MYLSVFIFHLSLAHTEGSWGGVAPHGVVGWQAGLRVGVHPIFRCWALRVVVVCADAGVEGVAAQLQTAALTGSNDGVAKSTSSTRVDYDGTSIIRAWWFHLHDSRQPASELLRGDITSQHGSMTCNHLCHGPVKGTERQAVGQKCFA